MSSPPTVLPIQYTPFTKEDLADPEVFNERFAQLFTRFNQLSGAAGPSPLHSGIELRGARVSGLGAPQSETDAISSGHASSSYSSAAQQPNLDIGGPHALKGLTAAYGMSVQNTQELAGILTPYVGGTGSMTLPNGVVEKWGHATTPGAVTFATKFPTACENVIVCDDHASGTAGRASVVGAPTATGFTFANDQAGNGVWWRAVGL